jgi:hypothetical protein
MRRLTRNGTRAGRERELSLAKDSASLRLQSLSRNPKFLAKHSNRTPFVYIMASEQPAAQQ